MDGPVHQEHSLAFILYAEKRSDIIGQQGGSQLVIGFDRVLDQFPSIAQKIALLGVAESNLIHAEDTRNHGCQDVSIGQSHFISPVNLILDASGMRSRLCRPKRRREWMGVEPTAARNATRHRC